MSQVPAQLDMLAGACGGQPAPAHLVGSPAPAASRGHGCKASSARACSFRAAGTDSASTALSPCSPNDKNRNVSLGKGVHAWRRHEASCGCDSVGSTTPSRYYSTSTLLHLHSALTTLPGHSTFSSLQRPSLCLQQRDSVGCAS